MDARNLQIPIIIEAISRSNYEITGILETGELVIAIVSDLEKNYLNQVLSSDKTNEEKLENVQSLMGTTGRTADELLQVYKQNTCGNNKKYFKGLRPR